MQIKKNHFGVQRILGWNVKCDKLIELYYKFRKQFIKGGGENNADLSNFENKCSL